jgi:hypothetical protein
MGFHKHCQGDNETAEKAFLAKGLFPRVATPYEHQLDFIVPRLCVSEEDAALPVEYDPRKRPAGELPPERCYG